MSEEQKVTRKLSAILSADVKGYSLLMADDEVHTIQTLKAYRKIISDLIFEHSGRVVDSPGDNILAEFRSTIDAVECAVKIQRKLAVENSKFVEEKRVRFRIGVNVGDVIEDSNRIYGNGVNVAARIEGLAEPGGICISRNAYDHISNKMELGYEYLGDHRVKNIKSPVRVYKVLMDSKDVGKLIGEKPKAPAGKLIVAAAAVILVLVSIIGFLVYQKMSEPEFEQASLKRMSLPLPVQPSIAVLPFDNMTGNPDNDYFSDGITEQIITSLSNVPFLFVIARNSTFAYKNKPLKIHQIAEELGVQYILEGSVQQSQKRVRITAQLIDAINGRHLWAESYDKETRNMFDLYDDITLKIVSQLQGELPSKDLGMASSIKTENLKAYEKYLKGYTQLWKRNIGATLEARKLALEAIELDSRYGAAYRLLASTYIDEIYLHKADNRTENLKKAANLIEKAVELGGSDSQTHEALSNLYFLKKDYERAIAEGQKAVTLNPNSAHACFIYGMVLGLNADYDRAIPVLEKALRLNPIRPINYLNQLAFAYAYTDQYEKALSLWEETISRKPNYYYGLIGLTAVNQILGREDKARSMAEELIKARPDFTVSVMRKRSITRNKEGLDMFCESLLKAGLPEVPPEKKTEKPSIAVLPFVNMSDEQDQAYFSDGISEEIITALSKTPKLFVIARTSSFKYKGKQVDIRTIGRELGVRYVLEGSVRRSEDKVRITAQLIDATTEKHLWAEQYAFELKDIFNIQDEITKKIITALRVQLTEGESARLLDKDTNNIQAFLKILEGIGYFDEDKYTEGMKSFEEAILLDPQSAAAHAWLSWGYLMNVWFGPSATRRQSLEKAFKLAEKCKALDPAGGGCYSALSHAYLMKRDYDKAISEGKRSIELGPNNSNAAVNYGWALRSVGRYEDALFEYERALRLNPLDKVRPLEHICTTYNMMRRHEKAIETCKKAIELNSRSLPSYINIAVAYSELDKMDEAREAASKVLKMNPNFSMDSFEKTLPYKNKADRDLYVNGLRKAGLK